MRRKDTQVKVRGQRIELDEMYQRITRNLADNDPEAGPESAHSPVEQIISEAVAWVINLPGQVSMRHSFIGMGGDSITAMQAIALCRRRGVSLPVQDIFKSANITVMAAKAQHLSSCDDSANDEDELAPFLLSPIQKLHLEQFPHGENHYNHSMLLKLRRPTSETVHHATELGDNPIQLTRDGWVAAIRGKSSRGWRGIRQLYDVSSSSPIYD